jgi:hypothetical protein
LQFPVDLERADTYGLAQKSLLPIFSRIRRFSRKMNSVIRFVELENRVVAASYRNLMVKAKVVLVERASGAALTEPVTTITSTLPSATLRIRLPDGIKPGIYFLLARNAHGDEVARSAGFIVG